jgi:hypothetical protein
MPKINIVLNEEQAQDLYDVLPFDNETCFTIVNLLDKILAFPKRDKSHSDLEQCEKTKIKVKRVKYFKK